MDKILYDNFEVHRVAEFDDENGGTYCEQIAEDEEFLPDCKNIFWTVYGHVANETPAIPKGGIEAISDFQNKAMAEELCDFLNGLLDKAGIGLDIRH